MKRIIPLLILLLGAMWPAAAAAPGKPQPILPDAFAGWQKSTTHLSASPADADRVNPGVLKEYAFGAFEEAVYIRPDRRMEVKAIRFRDATGSYGAFTFYKTPEMQTEKIGDQASSANNHVLFYRGNLLVEAVLDRVTPMSAAELRELASDLPLPAGNARNLPSLPLYLPRQGYIHNSAKYVVGPLAFAALDSAIPAAQVGFQSGAELVQAQYKTGEGSARLTVISYPTPQIAGEHLRTLEAAHPQTHDVGPSFFSKRSGPLVATVTGAISPREARSLLASVNYDAEVTWNQRTGLSPRDNAGTLIVGVVLLTAIILGLAVVAGIAFGGIRILAKRFFPDRIFDRSRDIEIIELKLH